MEQDWLTIENIDNEKVLTHCFVLADGEIVIPQGVTKIAEGAFDGCRDITSLVVPDSVVCINQSYRIDEGGINEYYYRKKVGVIEWNLNVLDFQGKIPETNGIFSKSHIDKLRINQPRKKCRIPSDILDALHMDNPRHNWSIVYAAPELYEEASSVPGYIRVTKALDNTIEYAEHDGDIIDINTKYIVSVEPVDIERYNPVKGSIIRCASNAHERAVDYRVYEPCKKVLQKIDTSLRVLSEQVGGVAGLLNQLETLCVDKPNLK